MQSEFDAKDDQSKIKFKQQLAIIRRPLHDFTIPAME